MSPRSIDAGLALVGLIIVTPVIAALAVPPTTGSRAKAMTAANANLPTLAVVILLLVDFIMVCRIAISATQPFLARQGIGSHQLSVLALVKQK